MSPDLMELSCPVCQSPLSLQDRTLRCANNHSFDAARQGYWNLLLAHKKRSRDPGDNAEMVQARRDFLDQGFYHDLSQRINQLALDACAATNTPRILDIGCGEGYYTVRLQEFLTQHLLPQDKQASITGLDISKHAVKAACQRSRELTWLVASGANIPMPEQSLDLILVLFSRLMPESFAKPLKPGASLLIAWPGEQHLIELRKLIYPSIRPSQFDPVDTLASHFQLQHQEQVTYPLTLSNAEQISTLLGMTPHSQRLTPEAKAQICNLEQLPLTLDVNLGLFTRL